ncbi:hypothetical protein Syun_020799 [Stephania yunnanensis]|uniref:5-formyltetrahydrofolate cyclo-ligase n=1 Tax=Stephania yunnanensis TaxID=152371 RepID=A0AAP0IGE6_9MAGN
MSRNGLLRRAKVGALLMSPPAAIAAAQTLFFSPLDLFSTSPSNHFQRSIAKMSTDPDPILLQKSALRSNVRKDLKAMDPSLRSQQDSAIQDLVLKSSWFRSKGHSQMVKTLYVPRVEDKNSHMRMLNITSTDDLIANSMNILEPSPVDRDGNQRENVMEANDPVDLLLLPGLAFDRSGRRLGRGGGYYDLFLKKYQELAAEKKWKQPLLVALSYGLQIMDEGVIPMTTGDVPVDALVTPTGVIPISPSAMERLRGFRALWINWEFFSHYIRTSTTKKGSCVFRLSFLSKDAEVRTLVKGCKWGEKSRSLRSPPWWGEYGNCSPSAGILCPTSFA